MVLVASTIFSAHFWLVPINYEYNFAIITILENGFTLLDRLLKSFITLDRELEKLKDEVIEREKKLRQPQTESVKHETKPQSTRYVNNACMGVFHQ